MCGKKFHVVLYRTCHGRLQNGVIFSMNAVDNFAMVPRLSAVGTDCTPLSVLLSVCRVPLIFVCFAEEMRNTRSDRLTD